MSNAIIFLKNLFNVNNSNAFITYDKINKEFLSISSPNVNIGNKLELTQSLTKNLQISSIITQYSKHYFVTLFKDFKPSSMVNYMILQFSHEVKGSSQIKYTLQMIRNLFLCRYQTIISKNKEVFSQLENIILTANNAFALKLIKPAFEASNLIYIVNYWRSLGIFGLGMEIVGIENLISINFGGRVSTYNSVISMYLQKFNSFSMSFYKRLTNNIECGVEYKRNIEIRKNRGLIAGRIRNKNTDIKITINHLLDSCFSWDEHLTQNFSVGISGDITNNILSYGFQMTYEN